MQPKIEGDPPPPRQFFLKALTPPWDLGKKHQVPFPLDFQPVCIYAIVPFNYQLIHGIVKINAEMSMLAKLPFFNDAYKANQSHLLLFFYCKVS
jgi:hypothetical protein